MSLTIVSVPDFREEAAGAREALRSAGVRVAPAERLVSGLEEALDAVLGGEASLALVRGDALNGPSSVRVRIAAVLPRSEPRDVLLPADPGHATPDGWMEVWRGGRPSDRKERWYLERREPES